jgi:predicted XRE-type DNA-binding protein
MAQKKYSSVSEMIRDVTGEEEAAKLIERDIAQRALVKQLIVLRSVKGMTQAEVAKKMNCTQSRVSKLEGGTDDDLKLADLRDYLHAIDHDIMLVVTTRETTLLSQIKWHVGRIKCGLNRLFSMSKGDEVMDKGATKAYAETLTAVLKLVLETADKVPGLRRHQELPRISEMDDSVTDCEEPDDTLAATS